MRRRRSSHGRLWLFQLRSECVGKFYQSLKNRGESELQKLNFNFGLIFWWLVNFTQEISYAFCQSLRFWVFTFEMWMYLHSKELYSLSVACVQQLLFSCRLCRWNFCQINLKYNDLLFFSFDKNTLMLITCSNSPDPTNQIASSGRNDRQKSEPDTNFADNLCVHEIGEIGGIMGDIFDIYAMVYDKVSTWCLQHVPS